MPPVMMHMAPLPLLTLDMNTRDLYGQHVDQQTRQPFWQACPKSSPSKMSNMCTSCWAMLQHFFFYEIRFNISSELVFFFCGWIIKPEFTFSSLWSNIHQNCRTYSFWLSSQSFVILLYFYTTTDGFNLWMFGVQQIPFSVNVCGECTNVAVSKTQWIAGLAINHARFANETVSIVF